jgi:hypothetical protein
LMPFSSSLTKRRNFSNYQVKLPALKGGACGALAGQDFFAKEIQ